MSINRLNGEAAKRTRRPYLNVLSIDLMKHRWILHVYTEGLEGYLKQYPEDISQKAELEVAVRLHQHIEFEMTIRGLHTAQNQAEMVHMAVDYDRKHWPKEAPKNNPLLEQ